MSGHSHRLAAGPYALRNVEHHGARLEQGETACFVGRNLPERMQRWKCDFLHLAERKKATSSSARPLPRSSDRPILASVSGGGMATISGEEVLVQRRACSSLERAASGQLAPQGRKRIMTSALRTGCVCALILLSPLLASCGGGGGGGAGTGTGSGTGAGKNYP